MVSIPIKPHPHSQINPELILDPFSWPKCAITAHSYSVLAPSVAAGKGFVDAKQITQNLVKAINLDTAEFRFGHTKACFPFPDRLALDFLNPSFCLLKPG